VGRHRKEEGRGRIFLDTEKRTPRQKPAGIVLYKAGKRNERKELRVSASKKQKKTTPGRGKRNGLRANPIKLLPFCKSPGVGKNEK